MVSPQECLIQFPRDEDGPDSTDSANTPRLLPVATGAVPLPHGRRYSKGLRAQPIELLRMDTSAEANHVGTSALMRRHLAVPLRLGCYSLFSGPGGLDLGFEQAGASILYAADIDRECVNTYNRNRPEGKRVARVQDLSTVDGKTILQGSLPHSGYDLLGVIGGPPCQSFSYANVYSTEDDPRHKLPEAYARIVGDLRREVGLDFFLFENVPGLLSGQHVAKFVRFTHLFEEAGFSVFQGALDAVNFGVAQVRPRVFVVGLNRDKYPGIRFSFPPGNPEAPPKTVRDVIWGLPEPVRNARGLDATQFPVHPNHWCLVPRSRKFAEGFSRRMGGKSFKVLDWDRPSYTVAYGHREVHVHPDGHRRLSIFEAMLLQGFPASYVLTGRISDQVRMVSEAVCPVVGNALANALIQALGGHVEGGVESGAGARALTEKAIP
jgi:DNA (cytosine-5)-methyltransferase 1